MRTPITIALFLVACGAETPGAGLEVRPGEGIGPVRIGMRYADVREALGPLEGAFTSDRLAFGRYASLGLEVVLVSSEDASVSDDAIVIGVGALRSDGFVGPVVPGMTRDALEDAFGEPDDEAGDTAFYVEGFSVERDGDAVLEVGVFRPYAHEPTPPPMRAAATRREGT
ncbi:hypothetical protein [Sandaracinus amylolyticus]|uniref:hypothetical protein n=1 Tax=Sandaracinus amylolyticus TaxID=927083 RepID=UPI001F3C7BDD|nr:hypothetical protein [Sandaracinus amylolyticus]UJR81953.1 Hypothetical protein I5071_40180 [Sandaracinus amylolyticus]